MNNFLAHDLLWGLTAQRLPGDAPAWAVDSIRAGQPVVVRRAQVAPGSIAVGVRGPQRGQRYATSMAMAEVTRRVRPQELCHVVSERDVPALKALARLRPLLDASGWSWGVAGSAGFELACGVPALHLHSDLDLILCAEQPLTRVQARALLSLLDTAGCAVDMQVQTPNGGVALREWAGAARRVLLKNAQQACLVSDPWEQTA